MILIGYCLILERLRRSTGGCAAFMCFWLADFCSYIASLCILLDILCVVCCSDISIDWENDCITSRLLLSYFYFFFSHDMTDSAWHCLKMPALNFILVIVLSVLCGWVPLYWRTYLLRSVIEACAAPTANRTRGRVASHWLIDTWETSYL